MKKIISYIIIGVAYLIPGKPHVWAVITWGQVLEARKRKEFFKVWGRY